MQETTPTRRITPADIPDNATCYVPGFGETTVGEIRRTEAIPADDEGLTIAMWGFIATHPDARPWKDGSWPPLSRGLEQRRRTQS